MAMKFSCKFCHKKFTQSKSRKRHNRVQHTKVNYTQARKSFDRRVKTLEGGFCKFESQQQEINQNENASSLEIQIVEELNHDFKFPQLPAMKLEAATEKEEVELSTSAAETGQTSLLSSTIDEETETQLQFWHPKLKPVKKEEPKDVEEPAPVAATVVLTGKTAVADQAPTKMLLRERKRPPVEVVEKNKKRTLRRGGTKK